MWLIKCREEQQGTICTFPEDDYLHNLNDPEQLLRVSPTDTEADIDISVFKSLEMY